MSIQISVPTGMNIVSMSPGGATCNNDLKFQARKFSAELLVVKFKHDMKQEDMRKIIKYMIYIAYPLLLFLTLLLTWITC